MDSKIVAHRVDGAGDPLLLLNGGLMSIPAWEPIAAPLAGGRRVVRLDFRGQLLTPVPPPATLDDHASDVVALLDALGIERADLLGTSFGGIVALIVAGRWPARVRRLVVVTATGALTPEMRRQAEALEQLAERGDGAALFRSLAAGTFSDRYLAAQPAGWVEERAKATAAMPRWWLDGVAGLMKALGTLDLAAVLPHIQAPTLVIGAGLDRTFPIENSRALAGAIPRSRLEILEGVGHGVVVEAPERIVALAEEFLSADDAGVVRASRPPLVSGSSDPGAGETPAPRGGTVHAKE